MHPHRNDSAPFNERNPGALVVLSAYHGPMLLFDLSYWTDGMYGQPGKGMIDDLPKYKITNSIRFQGTRFGVWGSPSSDPPEINVVMVDIRSFMLSC
ncbi:hypothetical protein M378DRAFT_163182, partial [Amanita muscaria Koide BX008]